MPEAEASPVTVRLSGVSVHTNHGVGAAEREVGQRMVFDLELELTECPATTSDELSGTVDYGAVTEELVGVARARSYLTLERLVTVIAETMLERFPQVSRATVRATKPEPPIPVVMDGASVEVTVARASGPGAPGGAGS
jgi:dihydroneopterin aldolase